MSASEQFDYNELDLETRNLVKQRTLEIKQHTRDLHSLMRQSVETAIEIGQKLKDVQEKLRGRFVDWLMSEFSWSKSTAYKYINLANKSTLFLEFLEFPQCGNSSRNLITLSAAYICIDSNTPEEARQEIFERAKRGQITTHSICKKIAAKHKSKALTNQKVEHPFSENPPKTPETKAQPDWQDQPKLKASTTDGINSEVEPSFNSSDSNEAEPEKPSSSRVCVSSLEQVKKDQLKEEPARKEEEDKDVAPGSSSPLVDSQKSFANATNYFRRDKDNDDDNQVQAPLVKEASNQDEQDEANTEAVKSITSDSEIQQEQQIQPQLEVPARDADQKAGLLEDDSAGKEQSKKEEQGKEARLAESEILSLSDAVKEDQSKVANETDKCSRQNDVNQDQKQVSDEKDRGIGDRLSEESPLFNETSNQQDKAKGKANQSPHSGENGACTHVAENPETSVEQQQQHTQPPPRVKPNDSTKVDLGDRNDPQIHDDSDASTFNLQNINAKQLVKQIVVAVDIAKTQLDVSNWAKVEIAEFVADVENCVAKLERLAKELKPKLENEHL